MIIPSYRPGGAFVSKKAKEYLKTINPTDKLKICVIRHAAIGDWIAARPFLIELKKYFPNATITVSAIGSYIYGIPDDLADEIHVVDKIDKNGKKTTFLQRYKQIKQLPKQDIIFDLSDSSLTLQIMLINNPKLKIGYPYRWIRRIFLDIATLRSDFVFETMSMMHQLNILGANTKHYPLEYKLSTKTTNKENPYIIYFGGASVQSRCWGDENFIELIRLMKEKYPNYNHVILKGIKDDEKFNEVYAPFKANLNVIHQDALPLDKIYDYLAESSLVVVGDTGLRNMAIGTHTPTVGLMFTSYLSPMRYLPKTENHQVVYNIDVSKPEFRKVFDTIITIIK